jgi:hypothetical protein
MAIEEIPVWRGRPGALFEDSIRAAIAEAQRRDPHGVGDTGDGFGTLIPFILIMNNIVLTISRESTVEGVMEEFHRRVERREGLYGR